MISRMAVFPVSVPQLFQQQQPIYAVAVNSCKVLLDLHVASAHPPTYQHGTELDSSRKPCCFLAACWCFPCIHLKWVKYKLRLVLGAAPSFFRLAGLFNSCGKSCGTRGTLVVKMQTSDVCPTSILHEVPFSKHRQTK